MNKDCLLLEPLAATRSIIGKKCMVSHMSNAKRSAVENEETMINYLPLMKNYNLCHNFPTVVNLIGI